MLGNRAHEGLQPPSNLEERKEFKESQYAAHIYCMTHPHPPRTRGAICASLEDSLARGLPVEALNRAPLLRLARG